MLFAKITPFPQKQNQGVFQGHKKYRIKWKAP